MNELNSQLDNLKLKYREIFLKTAENIQAKIISIKPQIDGEIFDKYPEKSDGKLWQKRTIEILERDYKNSLSEDLAKIKNTRKNCSCGCCGTCCRLACSEYSPDELLIKAKYGDKFAQQFTQTFVPYESIEEARKIFPEYIRMLEENNQSGYYFYHCPKVTKDNKCPDYENRPQICRDFPDNPVAFLPPLCGFKDWKLKSEHILLKLNAEAEITNFYIKKIKEVY